MYIYIHIKNRCRYYNCNFNNTKLYNAVRSMFHDSTRKWMDNLSNSKSISMRRVKKLHFIELQKKKMNWTSYESWPMCIHAHSHLYIYRFVIGLICVSDIMKNYIYAYGWNAPSGSKGISLVGRLKKLRAHDRDGYILIRIFVAEQLHLRGRNTRGMVIDNLWCIQISWRFNTYMVHIYERQ